MQGHDTNRVKIDDWTWSVECLQCHAWFEATRSDATFCSAKHRVAFSKEPQKRLNALQRVSDMHHELKQLSDKYKYDDEMFQAFQSLQKQINYCVQQFEEKNQV